MPAPKPSGGRKKIATKTSTPSVKSGLDSQTAKDLHFSRLGVKRRFVKKTTRFGTSI